MPDRPPRLEELYSWVRVHPFETDALLAAGLAFLLTLLPWVVGEDRVMLLIGLGLIVPLAWRRTRPVFSAAAITAVGVAQLTAYPRLVPADPAALIGIYSLAAYGPNWARRIGLPIGLAGALTAGFRYYQLSPQYAPLLVGFITMLVLATWSLGTLRRLGRREEERLTERARLLERERDQEGRLAATAERARIAREMHDVVAHSLSVTISQADGGRYAARTDPQAAIAALETISATGRQALADMRVLLGVLRQDEGRQLAPQPDTDTIPDLVEQVRAGGLEVSLEITGRAQKLPTGPALAAYRIVQESLTNVLKHAGPTSRAWVRLSWLPEVLELSVTDDGRGAGAVSGHADGQGVRGMQERALLHGGTLQAGPRTGGGFAVQAVLPYAGSRVASR
jgi:signal transduction histidine kinase